MTGSSGSRHNRFVKLGPAWISAVAALITALAALGFFASKGAPAAGAPVTTSTSAAAPTARSAIQLAQPSSAAPQALRGKTLAHYTVDVPDGYGMVLADHPSRPDQSNDDDFSILNGQVNGYTVQLALLNPGTDVSYAACTADTRYTSFLSPDRGEAFCMTGNQYIAGVTVLEVELMNPAYMRPGHNCLARLTATRKAAGCLPPNLGIPHGPGVSVGFVPVSTCAGTSDHGAVLGHRERVAPPADTAAPNTGHRDPAVCAQVITNDVRRVRTCAERTVPP